jgi:hypothetical protein
MLARGIEAVHRRRSAKRRPVQSGAIELLERAGSRTEGTGALWGGVCVGRFDPEPARRPWRLWAPRLQYASETSISVAIPSPKSFSHSHAPTTSTPR